ncbi:MAG: SMP-30/gluconolactonase/LRE family protein [Streptosporangiaceae bacterium]
MTRRLDAELVVPAQCELAEGPLWDAGRGLMRWVDILRGQVHALDVATGQHTWFGTGDEVGTAGLTRDGGLVLALSDRFARSGSDGQNLRPVDGFTIDGGTFRFNDGKPDPWGNFWAGTCTRADKGPPCAMYRLTPDGTVTELFGGIGLSNGLDWSDDRTAFYFADSHAGGVDVFTADPATGTLSDRRRFAEVTGGLPDGLTLDSEGGLWLAVWGSGELRRYTPGGQVDVVVSLPVTQVTSAAFGGPALDTLYITTARENFNPADLAAQPHAGDIFACTPGVTGRLPFGFGDPAAG